MKAGKARKKWGHIRHVRKMKQRKARKARKKLYLGRLKK